MKVSLKKIMFITILLMCAFMFTPKGVLAAPVENEIFEIETTIKIKGKEITYPIKVMVTGDEFYKTLKSEDGYTLIKDPDNGIICYATKAQDGTLISTKIAYTGIDLLGERALKTELQKGITEKTSAVEEKIANKKELLGVSTPEVASFSSISDMTSALSAGSNSNYKKKYTGEIVGITVLVDFPDLKSNITPTQVDNFCNNLSYSEFGNNGSVRKYFRDVSGNELDYTNIVVPYYYTAKHTLGYYTDSTYTEYSRAHELVREVIKFLEENNVDLSKLTKVSDGTLEGSVMALNILCAGTRSGIDDGLWPHAGTLGADGYKTKSGVIFSQYQMTDMGTNLTLGTFVHENGHMLFNWGDTYESALSPYGVGRYDLMSNQGTTNPPPPNPYYRAVLAGWGEIRNITNLADTTTVNVSANQVGTHMLVSNRMVSTSNIGSSSKEFFLIENIQANGRWSAFGTSGLYIWHIDKAPTSSPTGTHSKVSLKQADGRKDLEEKSNTGDSTDAFYASNKASFTTSTNPNTNWWDGTGSGISITNISAAGMEMQYTYSNSTNAKITLGTPILSSSPLYRGQSGTITIPVTTQGIANGTQLTVGVEDMNGSSIDYAFESITGTTISNNSANIKITLPDWAMPKQMSGVYNVTVSGGGAVAKTTTYEISKYENSKIKIRDIRYTPENAVETFVPQGQVPRLYPWVSPYAIAAIPVITENVPNGTVLNVSVYNSLYLFGTEEITVIGNTVNNNMANIVITLPIIAFGQWTYTIAIEGVGVEPVFTQFRVVGGTPPTTATEVVIDQYEPHIGVGEVFNLTATLYPSNISDKNVTWQINSSHEKTISNGKVSWATTNKQIATINASTGVITGIAPGMVSVRATSGSVTTVCYVYVEEDVTVPTTAIVTIKYAEKNNVSNILHTITSQAQAVGSTYSYTVPEEYVGGGKRYRTENFGAKTYTVKSSGNEITIEYIDVEKEVENKINSLYTVEITEGIRYITNMIEGTKVGAIKQALGFSTYYKIEITDINGAVLADDKNLGTGSAIKIMNQSSNIVSTYKIVVRGDITAEGTVNLYDIVRLVKYVYDPDPEFIWDESIKRAGKLTPTSGGPGLFDIQRLISYCFNGTQW